MNKYINYLFVIYAFSIPLSRGAISILSAVLFVLWLFSDDLKKKLTYLKSNPTIIYLTLFILFSIISLLWSDDFSSGVYYIRKYWYYLPILAISSTIKKEFVLYSIYAFLAGMFISEIISFGVFFEFWNTKHSTPELPSPFMSHIHFSIYLAITALILLNTLFYKDSLKIKLLYLFLFLTTTLNLFVNAGRTGQLAFIITFFLVLILNIKNKLKALLSAISIITILIVGAYHTSPVFKARIDVGIEDFNKITKEHKYCSSIGLRFGVWQNGIEIFMQNPIFGIGTTDSMDALYKNIDKNHPDMQCIKSMPSYHNFFIQVLVMLGLIGLILYAMIYISMLKLKFKNKEFQNMLFIFISVYTISSLTENVFHEQFTQAIFTLFTGLFLAQHRIENEV